MRLKNSGYQISIASTKMHLRREFDSGVGPTCFLFFGFVFKEREIAFILFTRTWRTASGHYSFDFNDSKTHRTVFKHTSPASFLYELYFYT